MTRFGITAVMVLIGGLTVAGSAAMAQSDSAAAAQQSESAAAPANATSTAPAAPRKVVQMGAASLSTRTSGAGVDSHEAVPVAKTVDNQVNNPPVDSVSGGASKKP